MNCIWLSILFAKSKTFVDSCTTTSLTRIFAVTVWTIWGPPTLRFLTSKLAEKGKFVGVNVVFQPDVAAGTVVEISSLLV